MNFKDILFISKKFEGKTNTSRILKFTKSAAVFSFLLGSFALVLSLSILDGFEDTLKEVTSKFTSDITIYSLTDQKVNIEDGAIKRILSKEDEYRMTIENPVIVRSNEEIEGFLAKGIESLNNFKLEKGAKFSSRNSYEIIISKEISNSLNTSIGDEIYLYSINNNGIYPTTDIMKFSVIDIYESGLGEYDKNILFIPLETASDFFYYPESSFTKIEIDTEEDIIKKTRELRTKIGFPYAVKNVLDFQQNALIWIQVQKEPVPLVLAIIIIVASLNIVTMLLIMIVEKTRQIGVLKILGCSNSDVLKVFLILGLKIALKGSISGIILAVGFILLQDNFNLIKINSSVYFLNSIPVSVNLIHYLLVFIISLLLAVLVISIPSLFAAKIKPIKALRFN